MGKYAIEASGIEKTFVKRRSLRELAKHPFRRAERLEALRGVDMQVPEGQLFSLLGPNGAGKTTLLKIFSCLVLPDKGRAVIGGEDTVHERRVKPKIGLVHSDERSFYWRLSARENLNFFARLYDVPARNIRSRVAELLARVDLTDDADRRFADFSSGMKQRMSIARALLHDPPILSMDEPTRSLDPAASLALRTFIERQLLKEDGKTILLATHNLPEAEALSDRLAILVKGKVRQVGTPSEVRRWGLREQRFALQLEPTTTPLTGPFRIISDDPGPPSRDVVIALDDGVRLDDVLRAILTNDVSLRACDRIEPDLEAAFSRIIEADE